MPSVTKGDRKMVPHTIFCYAEGQAGRWEAICLDFDIAVQGESFDSVYHDLNEAIAMYLESVLALPEGERVRFLRRRAPLSLRLRFLVHVVLTGLFGRGNDKERHEFLVPCPA